MKVAYGSNWGCQCIKELSDCSLMGCLHVNFQDEVSKPIQYFYMDHWARQHLVNAVKWILFDSKDPEYKKLGNSY